MGSKTDYLEDAIINHVLRNTALTSPTTVYVGLTTADPTETGSQTNEVSGGAYARQSMAFDAPSPSGKTRNTALVTFPTATASWGTVTHWFIADAASGGNMLYYGALDSSKTVGSGDVVEIAAGQMQINED